MAKYRLSSAAAGIVDAEPFLLDRLPWPEGVKEDSNSPTGYSRPIKGEPHHFISPGDMVVTTHDGDVYVVAKDAFERTYEPLPES
jgi:hypothetical protein